MKKRWNWIDTTIVIVILLTVLVFLNRDKLVEIIDRSSVSNEKDIAFVVEGDGLTQEMITELEIGDQIFSEEQLQNARVTKITTEPLPGQSKKRLDDYEDAEEIKVIVEIDGTVAFSGPYMDLGGQQIKVGQPFIMKTTKVEFLSTIKYIEVK